MKIWMHRPNVKGMVGIGKMAKPEMFYNTEAPGWGLFFPGPVTTEYITHAAPGVRYIVLKHDGCADVNMVKWTDFPEFYKWRG